MPMARRSPTLALDLSLLLYVSPLLKTVFLPAAEPDSDEIFHLSFLRPNRSSLYLLYAVS